MEENKTVVRNKEPDDMDSRLLIADENRHVLMTIIGPRVIVHPVYQDATETVEKACRILKETLLRALAPRGRSVSVELDTMILDKKGEADQERERMEQLLHRIEKRIEALDANESPMFEDDDKGSVFESFGGK